MRWLRHHQEKNRVKWQLTQLSAIAALSPSKEEKHMMIQIIFAGTIMYELYITLLWTLSSPPTLVCWARLAPHIPPFQFHTNNFSFLFPTSTSTNLPPPKFPPKSPSSFHISQFPPKKHMVPLSPWGALSGGWSNFLICQFGNDHCSPSTAIRLYNQQRSILMILFDSYPPYNQPHRKECLKNAGHHLHHFNVMWCDVE